MMMTIIIVIAKVVANLPVYTLHNYYKL